MTKVAIALGGNTGNVAKTFKKAAEMLKTNGFMLLEESPLFINRAVGCVQGTPDFTNRVITGKWKDSPEKLLALCNEIEVTLGRPQNHQSDMSRTIDLDLIIFGDKVIKTKKLTIPHPRAQTRDFVLIPLSQIAPDWIFPDTKLTVSESLEKLDPLCRK